MRLLLPRSKLLASLSKVQSVLDKRGIRPLLGYVIIEAKDKINIKVTNLQVYYDICIEGTIEKTGSTALPGRKLYDIIKESKGEIISINVEDNKIIIDDKVTNYNFYLVDFEDFPRIEYLDPSNKVQVDGKIFKKAVKTVSITVAEPDMNPHLAGVFIKKMDDGDKVRFMSSDNHSLSIRDFSLPEFNRILPDHLIMIPKSSINEILKQEDDKGPWKIGLKGDGLYIEPSEDCLCYITIRQEEFIDYSPLYTVKIEHKAILKKGPFGESLKRMSTFLEGYLKDTEMHFRAEDGGRLTLKAITDAGKAEEVLKISYEGDDFGVHMNPKELLSVAEVMESDEVEISFTEGVSACIITGKADPDYLCVLMPLVEEYQQ